MHPASKVPIYAISDIHGRIEELEILLEPIEEELSERKAKLVLLGDYIGYGMHSFKVMQKVLQLKRAFTDRVFVLAGNWEDMLFGALFEQNREYEQILVERRAGGFLSFLRKDDYLLDTAKKFLSIMEYAHHDGDIVFSHAGVNPQMLRCDSPHQVIACSMPQDLLWQSDFFLSHWRDQNIPLHYIIGHLPSQILQQEIFGAKPTKDTPTYGKRITSIDFGASRRTGSLGYLKIMPNGHQQDFSTPVIVESGKKERWGFSC